MTMKVSQILIGPNPHPQIRRAARDLRGYLNQLFGMNPSVRVHSGNDRGLTIQRFVRPSGRE